MTPDEHMRLARGYTDDIYAKAKGKASDKEMTALTTLATMHYLAFLAETKWDEDPFNDGKPR